MKKTKTERTASLPSDVTRCDGERIEGNGWEEGCETCLRRTAPRRNKFWVMEPPLRNGVRCDWEIQA